MKIIELTQNKQAIIDDSDFDWLNQWKWSLKTASGRHYAIRGVRVNGAIKHVFMHREIMNNPFSKEVDHIDGNSLNNQKGNLRTATHQQNGMNVKKQKNTISIYKGVSFNNRYGRIKRWVANIQFNGRHKTIGYFETQKEAARAYDLKAIELFGGFAKLNFDGYIPASPRGLPTVH